MYCIKAIVISLMQIKHAKRIDEVIQQLDDILASLVDEVEQKLAHIWPILKLLDHLGGKTDEALINFSMEKARVQAWKLAMDLAPLEKNDQKPVIASLDKDIESLPEKF